MVLDQSRFLCVQGGGVLERRAERRYGSFRERGNLRPSLTVFSIQMASPLPKELRKELATFARKLAKGYRAQFASDPALRKRAGQFLTALLPPKPRRRGRPGRKDVTQAIRLKAKFRRLYPEERPDQIWKRIYPLVISGYDAMSEVEQQDAPERLRERVRWRLRRRRYKGSSPANELRSYPDLIKPNHKYGSICAGGSAHQEFCRRKIRR